MSTGTRAQLGNGIFEDVLYLAAVTPPTITTGQVNPQNVSVPGVQVGDFISINLITPTSALITIANAYVSGPGIVVVGWTTEGATVSGAAAQQLLMCVLRPENGSMGLAALPQNVL